MSTTISEAIDQIEVEPGKRIMRVMDPKAGDLKIVWDPEKPDEVEHARKTFDELRKKGMAAFKVDKKGDKAKMLTTFDPDVEAMIMAPPLGGG